MRKLMKSQWWHELRGRVLRLDDDTDEPGRPGHVIANGYAEPASSRPWWAPDATWLRRIDRDGMRRAPDAA